LAVHPELAAEDEGASVYEQELAEMSEEERETITALEKLEWNGPGEYSLSGSHATLKVPENYALLTGESAHKFLEITKELPAPLLEALVIGADFQNHIYFAGINEGYVSIDEWGDINPATLLKEIQEQTLEQNAERKKLGRGPIYVKGWLQEPTLDKNTNIVHWALEIVSENGQSSANSVAFKLGRNGYEEILLLTDKESFVPFGGDLDVMLKAFNYEPGFRYDDYTVGDKVAEYGIATLVAAAAGGKLLKASGLLLIFKKYFFYLIAAAVGGLYKLKDFFFKKKNPEGGKA